MNFIVSFLLQTGFNEEECFWILAHIIECVIPIDYYTTMTGALCDKNIFSDLLKSHNKKLYYKLK